ncbi:tRNA (adenine(22)-N(1))-methyltransferase [Salinicoccus roseus]|uniref:tRNA (adenine(22)-N(1))-methyltransferase n=1 Tax=Salinicoccus roseus TaxID=45670 RepID=UPI000F515D22|nr:tRNA (adenine(22)-N(1))-methyltransferase TrmK [Salinicoccus roseus]RPE54203.1 tRNA (adenine22-N1)-methyltransferase [Salinicoccus roseus]GGA67429.1 tRNA methyltransferase [Salinicoccus roseus]
MLDARLQKVSEFIVGEKLLDIGSDHAYLPIEAIRNGAVSQAICGEVVNGPFDSTVNNIRREGMEDLIEARFGSGLEVASPDDEVDTVTICGMGGPLIAEILEGGLHNLGGQPRLVLQANTYTYPIRKVLASSSYRIIDETVIRIGRHFYEIIVAEPGSSNYDEKQLIFGPILLEKREQAFIEKLERELEHQRNIYGNLKQNSSNTEKIDEVADTINALKEVLEQ